MLTLQELRGLVVIDEVQRQPELFPILRILADRKPAPARFLILGSASPRLVKGVSESLAGRTAFVEVDGFDLSELGPDVLQQRWVRGGFPDSFLAEDEQASMTWRYNFIRTFLERDVPQLGIQIPAAALRRFWTMVAHVHGNVWNASELARSLGVNEKTSRKYLDIMTGTFSVRQLQPWFENLSKRQVKSPKVYLRDSGLLHALLAVENKAQLEGHSKCGASWEGFVIEQIIRKLRPEQAYFWATHGKAELDLLILRGGKRLGFEVKYTDAPRTTKSMHVALHDLNLERLYLVYPGPQRFALSESIEALSLPQLLEETL